MPQSQALQVVNPDTIASLAHEALRDINERIARDEVHNPLGLQLVFDPTMPHAFRCSIDPVDAQACWEKLRHAEFYAMPVLDRPADEDGWFTPLPGHLPVSWPQASPTRMSLRYHGPMSASRVTIRHDDAPLWLLLANATQHAVAIVAPNAVERMAGWAETHRDFIETRQQGRKSEALISQVLGAIVLLGVVVHFLGL